MENNDCLRVLNLLNELRYSGAEVMLRDACDFFRRAGIQTTILATGDNRGPYAETLEKCHYTIEHIPFEKSPQYFWRLYRFMKSNQFDVIHIHAERAYFYHALAARLATRGRIVRSVLDVFCQYGQRKKRIRRIQRYVARKWFSVQGISISHSVHEVELAEFSNPTEIIYDWIDDDTFRVPSDQQRRQARKALSLSENDFVLCTVGTCNEKKRHKDIFDAVARVKHRIPSLVLLHRGTGPDTEQEVEYVQRLGTEKNVVFLPYADSMEAIYWASDCFIFSSKWEGLGNVIVQAIACGLPVILYEGWGMSDFKPPEDRPFGYWVDPQTETFDSAIVDLFENRTRLMPEFRANARLQYEEQFSAKQSLQKLVDVYRGKPAVRPAGEVFSH
jgi:glycosyltransferase involved in cell wall biosynthesis